MTDAFLPCPFQFGRWGQGPVEAVLQGSGAGTGCQETSAVLRIVSNLKGCSYPQGWQVCSLEKCVSPTSQAIFANPLSRQGRKVSSPFCQEGSRPSSFMGLSQEGEYIPFVRKELSFQRAASYSRLMSWSETCQFQCCDLYLEFCLLKWHWAVVFKVWSTDPWGSQDPFYLR